MDREEYEKMSTFDKIDYDIQMELYMKYNDTIATINDHLGEQYSYSDLKDYDDLEKQDELTLYRKALKEKCDCLDKIKTTIENYKHLCRDKGLSMNLTVCMIEDILKGDSNE